MTNHTVRSTLLTLALTLLSSCVDVPPVAFDEAPDLSVETGGYATLYLRGGDELPPGVTTAALGEPTWDAALPPGGTFVVRVLAFAGETLHVAATPVSAGTGDAVVAIHDRSRAELQRGNASARRVEIVHMPRVATTGPHYVTVTCPPGPACPSLELFVSRGDDDAQFTSSSTATYVNQRSFATEDARRCTVPTGTGTSHVVGDCMCAPSSASGRMASLGVIPVDDVRAVAEDLFSTNSADGAANRALLMGRMRDVYRLSCSEVTSDLSTAAREGLRRGDLVLFRSSAFSGSGHYVGMSAVRRIGGRTWMVVDDPNGSWVSSGRWSPLNGRSASDSAGWSQVYDLDALTSGASLIVCSLPASGATTPPASPVITVSAPAAGAYTVGTTLSVAWSTSGASTGRLRMVGVRADFSELGTIATELPLAGRYDTLVLPSSWIGVGNRVCLTSASPAYSGCSAPFDVIAAAVAPPPPAATSLLANSDMSDSTDVLVPASGDGYARWGCWHDEPIAGAVGCSFATVDGQTVLRAVPTRAVLEWQVQLSQSVMLRDGANYVLRIRARASRPVTLRVQVDHQWMNLDHGLATDATFETTFREISLPFRATTGGQPSKVAIHLGALGVGTTFEVDRVVLSEM